MDSKNAVAGSTLALTQTVTVWTILMPPIWEVRENTPGRDPGFADDMRQTECVAGLISVAVGYIMTKVEHSWNPLICSTLLVLTLIAAYEYVLFTDKRHLTSVTTTERHNQS